MSEVTFDRIKVGGEKQPVTREIAEEAPVALEFNGLGYAVLMATPADLVDLAYGFALADRLIDTAADIKDVEIHPTPSGHIVRTFLAERCRPRLLDRVRHRTSDSSCGLCGIENLEQAMRPLPRSVGGGHAPERAIFAALAALARHQPLNRSTGAVHAAAWCDAEGGVQRVREDVGRHNAFDKLIGSMLRAGDAWDVGFALLSSRCSYELVEKAVLAGCPMLVTISAPTSLAVTRAREAGLRLIVLARPDALLVLTPGREAGA